MAASTTTNKVLIDAQKIIDTWAANPTFKLGEVTQAGFTTSRSELETLDNLIETRRNELKGLMGKPRGSGLQYSKNEMDREVWAE